MTIEITEVSRQKQGDWDSYVEQAPHAMPFHQYTALNLFAEHCDADLHLLVGHKGQEPVGILPLFETERGPFIKIQSPPLETELMHLGPLRLNFEQLKKRKAESNHKRFIDACWEWIRSEIEPDMVSIRCGDRYTDIRPYLWNDFEAVPAYIYVIDLSQDAEVLFNELTSEARRLIRNTDTDAYEIVEGSAEDTRTIARQVSDRYEEQGRNYGLTPEFMAEFHTALPDQQVHPYCLYTDGELVSGLICLEFGDTMHVWQGGAVTDADLPVNELLYWHVIERAASKGLGRVDLTTAMVPSLANYKAKFGPEPRLILDVRWRSQAWQLAAFGYKQTPEVGRNIVQSLLS